MDMPNFNRRESDKKIYFGGLRDINGWITKALMALASWAFINMSQDFKDLQKTVARIDIEAATSGERINNITKTQARFEKKFEILESMVWKK